MPGQRQAIHDTYVRTKPAVLNESARTIRFNFVIYHIPEAQGGLLNTLYNQLNAAIAAHDYEALSSVLATLAPYKAQEHIKPAWKQTEIYDPFDQKVID